MVCASCVLFNTMLASLVSRWSAGVTAAWPPGECDSVDVCPRGKHPQAWAWLESQLPVQSLSHVPECWESIISFFSSPKPCCRSSGLLTGAWGGTSDGRRSCSGTGGTAALCLFRATSLATPGCRPGHWDLKLLHHESLCGHVHNHGACMLLWEQQGFVVLVLKERCYIYYTKDML